MTRYLFQTGGDRGNAYEAYIVLDGYSDIILAGVSAYISLSELLQPPVLVVVDLGNPTPLIHATHVGKAPLLVVSCG